MKKTICTSAVLCAMLLGQPVLAQTCPSKATVNVSQPVAVHHVDDKDLVDTAIGAGKFNTLVAAAKAAGLVEILKSDGPLTVFAPTDEAFAKLPAGTVESLLKPENKDQLVAILTYHVIAGNVLAADVVKLDSAKSVQGQSVKISTANGKVMIDQANVIATDIACSNGTIHVIDSVIMPKPTPDIVDTAVAAGKFNTLAAALKAAGLVDTLKGKGPFTVFAPTDEAFAKLPKGTVEELLKPENKAKLASILTYHVLAGKVMASDVVKLTENAPAIKLQDGTSLPPNSALAKSVQGSEIRINVTDGKVMVNDANVVITDIESSNGVIHVIDSVILPK